MRALGFRLGRGGIGFPFVALILNSASLGFPIIAEQKNMTNIFENMQAETDFQISYGRFMQRWARIEQATFHIFRWFSQIPEPLARSIFYSSKNFTGRADMLESTFGHINEWKEYLPAVKAAIKKARQFSGFRNQIAHGEPRWDIRNVSPTFKQYVLVGERTLFR